MFLEQRFFSCGTAQVTKLVPLGRLCLCLVAWAALVLSLQQDPCFSPIILLHLAGREATSSVMGSSSRQASEPLGRDTGAAMGFGIWGANGKRCWRCGGRGPSARVHV